MKKCKAAFFGNTESYFNMVFSLEKQKEIRNITEMLPERITAQNMDSHDLSDVEVIFATWGFFAPSDLQLQHMKNLKAVFYAAGAVDGFARPFFRHNIRIFSAWKANAVPVAEMAAAQILLSLKNYFAFTRAVREPSKWRRDLYPCPGAYGETVALIGSGTISTMVKEFLQKHDLKILTIATNPEDRTISLEEAFRKAYVISNHLPNLETNQKVITEEMFASMRQGATFINTGRGAQIDEEGLCRVLQKRPDLSVLLDVTAPAEPPVKDSPLYQLPNVFLSPHIAGSWNDEVYRMADYMIEDYKRYVNGEEPRNEFTESMLPPLP